MSDNNFTAKQLNWSKQYLNEETADVFFICGQGENKERIPAHKFVLFTNSDVFARMFRGRLPELNEFKILDASPNGFRTFLRYFYFDEYLLNIDVIDEAMYLAKIYMIDDYFDACCAFLKKKPEENVAKHILVGLELAIEYELMDLKSFFHKRILRNDEEVFGSEYTRLISYSLLEHILQIHGTHLHPKTVFNACMGWAEEACIKANVDSSMQNRRTKLGDCFNRIKFGEMNQADLVLYAIKYHDLFTEEELEHFIIMIQAKCPTLGPTSNKYWTTQRIGRSMQLKTELEKNLVEEVHFNPRAKIILNGIVIAPLITSSCHPLNLHGIIEIVKTSSNKQKADDILLLREIFIAENIDYSLFNGKKLMFKESIMVEPHSNYSLLLTFDLIGMNLPYHYNSISPAEYKHFQVLSQTKCKAISAFVYTVV